METLLLAENNAALRQALADALSEDYRVTVCSDGEEALSLLTASVPDILVMNFSLPNVDGLSLLRRAPALPPVILALGTFLPEYVLQEARDLGVSHVLQLPCSLSCVREHLARLCSQPVAPQAPLDPQTRTAVHLQILKVSPHRSGYQPLRVGVPLYAQDPKQSLSKELYPAIAALCRIRSGALVGKSIERSIKAAWDQRDSAVWEYYFPGCGSRCPRNREFLSSLAEKIRE